MATLAVEEHRREGASRSASRLAYRCIDLTLACLALLALAPLIALLCVAVRIDSSGPAIFRQRRLGRDKRPFTMHKFRTMRAEADASVHREYVAQLIGGIETTRAREDGTSLYKLAADDRVTRVGRILRKTSLDELPQLLDVARGRMSLVGPRPVIPYEAELYPPAYDRRFAVKPGLTGLWQISGRSERTYREMVELDIEWAESHSLRRYLEILLRTPWVLLCRRGAA
jgi:lipopolysaccharide/colanic/teichoic acid biosynthesis glycosyltransferase